jgi:hypothetical protein
MSYILIQGSAKILGKTKFWTEDGPSYDSTAAAYIAAVEAADGQALEASVKTAYNNFIVGCKADGIWNAIKASCILAGARTLNGALVPLVGTAPTNNNFVSANYNRETGLKGGSTKRLIANRLNNADPQNSKHLAVWKTEPESTSADSVVLGTRFATSGGHSHLYTQATTGRQYFGANGADGGFRTGGGDATVATGLIGVSRFSATQFVRRLYSVSTTTANNSTTPNSEAIRVFGNNLNAMHSTSRVSFYSIGENLDLAALDTRVSNLMTAINAAI